MGYRDSNYAMLYGEDFETVLDQVWDQGTEVEMLLQDSLCACGWEGGAVGGEGWLHKERYGAGRLVICVA